LSQFNFGFQSVVVDSLLEHYYDFLMHNSSFLLYYVIFQLSLL